jgi:predicted membrane metal-binding protein
VLLTNLNNRLSLTQTVAHCSYLDIYISRKIRLCVVDFVGKFQTNLPAKPINFLVWKFKSIILIFLLFFAEFVKSTAFYTLLLLFQKVDIFELQFHAKITIQICQLFRIATTVCKKAVDLTNSEKNKIRISIIRRSEFPDQKVD